LPEQQANRFIKYYGTPTWADLDRKNKRKKLKRVKKVRLLNEDEIAEEEEPDKARLKSVEFHPNARVMLTGGLNQKLTLFQVI